MNKLTKKKHFVGVDISKSTLDLSLTEEETFGHFFDKKIENSISGFDSILQWLKKHKKKPEDCVFCMEHTGTYGLLFFFWLSQMGIDYCVEPGIHIKRSMGLTRSKNDKVDARRIAEYAYTNKIKLKTFSLPSTLIVKIKQLLTYREQTIRIRTSLKNSLKSHEQYQKISGLTLVTETIKEQIEQQNSLIDTIENQIVEIIKSDSQLEKNYELVTSVKGIGFVIAAFMLVTTNNFTSFNDGRKYACYSGIAPFENTSGTTIKGKTKVSNLGNKTMKTLLTNGANSAATWDPELKAYYNRKEKEGKGHQLIINSIRCKLVNRVFAVIKRQTPYVRLHQHNFA